MDLVSVIDVSMNNRFRIVSSLWIFWAKEHRDVRGRLLHGYANMLTRSTSSVTNFASWRKIKIIMYYSCLTEFNQILHTQLRNSWIKQINNRAIWNKIRFEFCFISSFYFIFPDMDLCGLQKLKESQSVNISIYSIWLQNSEAAWLRWYEAQTHQLHFVDSLSISILTVNWNEYGLI